MPEPTRSISRRGAGEAVDSEVIGKDGGSRPEGVEPTRAARSSYRGGRPGGRLRRSLAARISMLVLLVVAATAGSALVTLGQLRALQDGFDSLTEVYVQFNDHLASAHIQAVRIGEQVHTHQGRALADRGAPEIPRVDDAFLATFGVGLDHRNAEIAAARAPVEHAIADSSRFSGVGQRQRLQEILVLLDDLENLARVDAVVEPADVLEDVRTQGQIEQLFEQLGAKSDLAIEELRSDYRDTQVLVQWMTLGVTLGTTAIGILAVFGVVLTLRPLRRLSDSVRSLGRGDWSQRVDASVAAREDEVGHLASEFNDMAGALEERERRLLRGERLAAAGQLAAQITHEIRNPLSSVVLNAELLEDELSPDATEARELLATITNEVERLTTITDDYLRFARRPRPERSRIDLVRELSNLLDFMGHELESAGLEVITEFPEGPVEVSGDPNQLRQAFMNLLRNAQEALVGEAPGEGTSDPQLRLTVRCKAERVYLVVKDNGPGIGLPREQLDTIFEAFFTRKARGTGLGLPTVQQILQDHDGGVRVAETGPSGTIFEVSLPACRPDTASVSSDSADG